MTNLVCIFKKWYKYALNKITLKKIHSILVKHDSSLHVKTRLQGQSIFSIFGYTNSGDGPYSHPITSTELVRNYSASHLKRTSSFQVFPCVSLLALLKTQLKSICLIKPSLCPGKMKRTGVRWKLCQWQPGFPTPGKGSLGNSLPLGVVSESYKWMTILPWVLTTSGRWESQSPE